MDHLTSQKNRRILIVDDNAALHEDFRKILCPPPGAGSSMAATEELLFGPLAMTAPTPAFELDSAYQGQEGLIRVKQALQEQRPYAVAFIDVRMPPGWDGIETTVRIWEACPDLEVVICTAYSDYSLGEMLARLGNEERLVILKKPFDTIEVLQLANALTSKWRWHQEANLKMECLDKLVQARTAELVQANACLREQTRLLDLAQDAIFVWNMQGEVRYWNKGAERLYGWTADEVVGHRLEDRYCDSQAAREKERKAWHSLDGGEWSGELCHIAKSGRPKLVQSRWTLVRDSKGRPEAVLVINTDIMEKKELEAQFFRARRMDSIGTLAGGIAHDLNNVLAPVMMIGPLLRAQIQDEETRGLLENMERGAARGANIVKEILTFSRRGGLSKKAPLHTYRLLRGAVDFLTDTFPKSIRVDFSAPKDLWMVEANSAELHQALMNLCTNAREAMPGGGALAIEASNVVLDASAAAAIPNAHPGRYVRWRVADTGVGIAADDLDNIFDPFFTTKDIGKGPGLGLSSVLATVTGCGGSIQVKSQRGQGAEFILHFPAVEAVLGRVPRPLPEPPRGLGELILVAEEDASIGELLQSILTASGYRVLATTDGSEALELFRRHQDEINAVLADEGVEMPSGESVAAAIYALDAGAKIIVGSDIPPDQWTPLPRALHRHLLRKPYATDLLLDKLRSLLGAPRNQSLAVK